MRRIDRFELDCGMPLLVERHDTAQSAALAWLLPVGSSVESEGLQGAGTCLAEWIWRGADDLDARGLSNALDRCGVQRSSHIGSRHLYLSATLIGNRMAEALPLITSLVTVPRFEDATFEPVRDLSIQALDGLKDEPQHRAMLLVKERHFPAPFNRSGYGLRPDLESMNPAEVRGLWRQRVKPRNAILALAGDVDGEAVARQLDELLCGWEGQVAEATAQPNPPRVYHHEAEETNQVHIAVAYDAPAEPEPESVLQRIAVAVLSGGMSGRLFTEVREKRSLCYSVNASYIATRDRGAVTAYSGTTPERAQDTLDVLLGELVRIREGVTQAEFQRALVGFKSRLVMQGESTGARASAIANDRYILGRARTLEDVKAELESVTLARLNDYLAGHPPAAFSVVTLGPRPLRMPSALDAAAPSTVGAGLPA